MFSVCLTIFSSILSPTQLVSYVKVHVYCVFDYFLFNLVSTSAGEFHESACLLCVWLFSLQSCLHFSRWVTWKCMFIVCLTIFSSILSPTQLVSYVKVHVYCVFDYFLFNLVSTQSVSCLKVHVHCVFDYFLFNLVSTSAGELHESACLLCLTIFSSILSPLQAVSYMKVHVYCVFDYFLFNLVSNSVGELRESACLLCVWLFSLQSCLHFRGWVTWKCMFIVCLTIFSSILSPLQGVSYVKVHVYCVFDYFLFNLVSTSVGELRESACLLCVWLFSLQSCLQLSMSYMKVHVHCVFDYFLFNLVSTSGGELHESACLLCVWLFSLQSCLQLSWWVTWKVHVYCVFDYFLFNLVSTSAWWVTWKCMFIVCLTIFSSILSPLQPVSYMKVHVYCVFDYFLFNLVSTQLVSYVKVHVYCVFDYFLFNLVSNSVGELRESACLLCVWLFSLQSCLHFSMSYMKVHVYCVFDYFLFNLVSNSVGELRESACLLCVWLFSLQSCLQLSWWVTRESGVQDWSLKIVKHTINMSPLTRWVSGRQVYWSENSQTHNKSCHPTQPVRQDESACLLCVLNTKHFLVTQSGDLKRKELNSTFM